MDTVNHLHNHADHQKKYVDLVCGMSTEDVHEFIQHNTLELSIHFVARIVWQNFKKNQSSMPKLQMIHP